MNYKFISITPKSIDQHVEVRLIARKTTLNDSLTTILDDFPEDLIPIISAYVINDQVSFYKQIIDTFLKTHKKAAKTRIRLDSEQINRLSMYLLYQLLKPDIPDMTSLETYFFEPINIISRPRAGLYDGTGVTKRLVCGYICDIDRKSIDRIGEFLNTIRGDLLDGQGTMYYSNGERYDGKWTDNKPHGWGIYYWPDGRRYEGKWTDNKPHGWGIYYWPDGRRYEGEWADNKPHGWGIYYWPDGRRYQGKWTDNKSHGWGIYYWPDGRRYEGDWTDNKPHGQGTMYYSNGERYDGKWKADKKYGQGSTHRADGSVIYQGEWKADKKYGQGSTHRADGSVEYRGKWKNNQPDHSRSLTSKISSFFNRNDFMPDE